MIQLKDVLYYYVGCSVEYTGMANHKILTGSWLSSLLETNAWKNIKPILRPLSDLTEDEKKELDLLFMPPKGYAKRTVIYEAERTHYLLSKHFDLFGFIESGQAIDKTKL